ncbi:MULTISPECIES: aminoglycoside phosphotransferase family protein [unclassified Saccharothrix]|uniref:aminoglycoside phosphotransferase family protein n=1 Tax=unclassified Saccharothrix TaxID=2593673 RepID=UPI00307E054E
MNVEAITARLAVRFGPEVAEWCAAAPALTARVSSQWGLEVGDLIDDGGSSVVLRCTWTDGTPAILKLTPDQGFLASQAEMLRSLAPSGRVPAVFAVAEEAIVLEAVVPGTEASPTPEQWGELVKALHSVPPPPDLTRTLRGRVEEFVVRIGRRAAEPAIAARVSPELWDRTVARCRALLDSPTREVLLHGDLHPGNVLDGGALGLVAIDPKTCVGDPCFDAMDYVVEGAGKEGVEVRCAAVAEACGLDPERLLEWSRVNATLAAIGRLTWGDGSEEELAELLAFAR